MRALTSIHFCGSITFVVSLSLTCYIHSSIHSLLWKPRTKALDDQDRLIGARFQISHGRQIEIYPYALGCVVPICLAPINLFQPVHGSLAKNAVAPLLRTTRKVNPVA